MGGNYEIYVPCQGCAQHCLRSLVGCQCCACSASGSSGLVPLGLQVCLVGIFSGGLDVRDVATNNLIAETASLLVLLKQILGEELSAYLAGPTGPAAAAGASQAFMQGLALQLVAPDAKQLKAFLQQALRDAKSTGRAWP